MTPFTRDEVAQRLAHSIPPHTYVNLGIGLPSLVARHIQADRDITLHSENGLLDFGGPPPPDQIDLDLVDAGKNPVTLRPNTAFFDSALSFAMMRGGHLDIAVLGAFEVSAQGDLANWWTGTPGDPQGVGGAMDLASGAREIWVIMEHRTKDGRPKIVPSCTYPLTAARVVTRIFTDLATLRLTPAGLLVESLAPGLDLATLQSFTGPPLTAA